MDSLIDRYNALCGYLQESSVLKLKKTVENLNESNMEDFEKKLAKAEEQQKSLDPWIKQLKEKHDQFKFISENADSCTSDAFKRSYEAQKKKLKEYEWDENGKLVKGAPTEAKVKKINMQTLQDLFDKEKKKPVQRQMVNREKFETLQSRCNSDLQKIMPLIQKSVDGTDILEQLNAQFAKLKEVFDNEEDNEVDVAPLIAISNKLLVLNKKKSQKCKCGKEIVHKDQCKKCWKNHWADVYRDVKRRERSFEKTLTRQALSEYEVKLSHPFEEAYYLIEHGDKSSYAKIEKIYNSIDKMLPSLDSIEESNILTYAPDRDNGLSSSFEEDSFIESDSDSNSDSDSESESESSYERRKSTKKRDRVGIDDVLEILAPQNDLASTLLTAYKESDDFAAEFKRIKRTCVDTYSVGIFKDNKRVPIALQEPNTFFSEEEAKARAEALTKVYGLEVQAFKLLKSELD